jgi:hypothetical protein
MSKAKKKPLPLKTIYIVVAIGDVREYRSNGVPGVFVTSGDAEEAIDNAFRGERPHGLLERDEYKVMRFDRYKRPKKRAKPKGKTPTAKFVVWHVCGFRSRNEGIRSTYLTFAAAERALRRYLLTNPEDTGEYSVRSI